MADEEQNAGSDEQGVHNNAPTTSPKMPGGITGKGFQPGQSGNPGGRPKKKPITEMFEQMFENEEDYELIKLAIRSVFVEKSGIAKVMLLKDAADRIEGKVTQPIDANVNVGLSERLEAARKRLSEG